jgi:hypothetical protein
MDPLLRRKIAAVCIVDAAIDHYEKHIFKIPEHISILSGNAHTLELLDSANPNSFKRAARMDKDTFYLLVDKIRARGLLYDTRKGVTVERYHSSLLKPRIGSSFSSFTLSA